MMLGIGPGSHAGTSGMMGSQDFQSSTASECWHDALQISPCVYKGVRPLGLRAAFGVGLTLLKMPAGRARVYDKGQTLSVWCMLALAEDASRQGLGFRAQGKG